MIFLLKKLVSFKNVTSIPDGHQIHEDGSIIQKEPCLVDSSWAFSFRYLFGMSLSQVLVCHPEKCSSIFLKEADKNSTVFVNWWTQAAWSTPKNHSWHVFFFTVILMTSYYLEFSELCLVATIVKLLPSHTVALNHLIIVQGKESKDRQTFF